MPHVMNQLLLSFSFSSWLAAPPSGSKVRVFLSEFKWLSHRKLFYELGSASQEEILNKFLFQYIVLMCVCAF